MIYTPLTKKALDISFHAHKNQLDKGGAPYVYHPFHLAEQMDEEYAVCVALLHDVVEDTPITVGDLKAAGFPPQVTDAVALLVHLHGVPYFDYVRALKENPIAAKVKLADLRHNRELSRLPQVSAHSLERVKKYDEAIRILTEPDIRDRIRGSLFGGAAGDALGYGVEFLSEPAIFQTYGSGGIQGYAPDPVTGEAVISDDTQMTLFTAGALILGMYRQKGKGISADPRHYANLAYRDWLTTQELTYEEARKHLCSYPDGWITPLLKEVPALFARRAPGLTCLSALKQRREQLKNKKFISDFLTDPLNHSKGCGGIMRVAPVGLALHRFGRGRLALESAQIAAITHGHPLGYMPAAVLAHILDRIVYSPPRPLKEHVQEAGEMLPRLFGADPHVGVLRALMEKAIALSENNAPDLDNIHLLGEGWVAEETLAIALYCCLRYEDDFSRALTVSVNHKGDSDSTGAVTGNILGAIHGFDAIPGQWKSGLELSDLILTVADTLYEEFK